MLWIGITGPIGGGKSTVSELLRQQGYPVVDADAVVHQLLSPGGVAEAAVFKTFGENLRNSQGALDRRALGQKVFADPSQLSLLEGVLHPLVRMAVARQRQMLADQGHKVAFYDVPLLFEKSMQEQFDSVIVISASVDQRRARFKKRTGLSDSEFNARNQRQLPVEEKMRLANAVIQNDGEQQQLRLEIARVLQQLKIPSPPSANS